MASTNLPKVAICLPSSPSAKASLPGVEAGQAGRRVDGDAHDLLGAWCSATSSISMPPSVDAMTVMREVARSTSSERYSSRLMSQPAST